MIIPPLGFCQCRAGTVNQFWYDNNTMIEVTCWDIAGKYPLPYDPTLLNREDGPAVISCVGEFQWCVKGQNITLAVQDWFDDMGWNEADGLDTPDKRNLFRLKFL